MAVEVGGSPLKFSAVIDFSDADKQVDSFYKRMSDKAKAGVGGGLDKSFSDIVKSQEESLSSQQKLLQSMSSQYRSLMSEAVTSFNAQEKASQRLYHNLASLRNEQRRLSEAQRDLASGFKNGTVTQKQYIEGSRALALQQNSVKQRISETSASIRQQESLERKAIGSIAEKTARLTQIRREYDLLSEAQRNNANVGGRLQQEYRKLSTEVQNLNTQLTGVRAGQNGIGAIFSNLKGIAGALGIAFGAQQLIAFGRELFDIAKQAEGVQRAFDRMSGDSAQNLQKLRTATKGTVSDLELMKLAVRSQNFKIPMDVLAKGLEFARQRANDTGQSVDYLVNSFVDGIGRQSKLVLDNLGISANELSKEIEKTGDFAKAAGNIIEREMGKASSSVDTFGDRVNRLSGGWENVKLKMSTFFADLAVELTDIVSSDTWKEFWDRVSNYGQGRKVTQAKNLKAVYDEVSKASPFTSDMSIVNLIKSGEDYRKLLSEAEGYYEKIKKARQEYSDAVQIGSLKESKTTINDYKKVEEAALDRLRTIQRVGKDYSLDIVDRSKKVGESINDLKEKVKSLTEERDKELDVNKIKKYNVQIDALNKKISTLTGSDAKKINSQAESEAKKLAEQIKRDNESYNKLLKEIISTGGKYSDEIVTREQAEINSVIADYDRLIEKAEEYNATTKSDKIDVSTIEYEKGLAVNRVIERQEREAESKRQEDAKKSYEALLKKYETYQQKRERLIKEANKEIAELEAKGEKDRAKAAQKAKEDAIKQLYIDEIESSGFFATLQRDIEKSSPLIMSETLKMGAKALRNYIKGMKLSPKMEKELVDKFVSPLEKAGNESVKGDFQFVDSLLSNFDQLVNLATQFDGTLGNALKTVGQMVGQVSEISKSLGEALGSTGKGLSSTGGVGAIVGAVLSIMGTVIQIGEQAHEKRMAEYKEQQDMQIKQIEAVTKALEYQLQIIKDIYGTERVKAYAKAVNDSIESVNNSIKDLPSGQLLFGDDKQDNYRAQIYNRYGGDLDAMIRRANELSREIDKNAWKPWENSNNNKRAMELTALESAIKFYRSGVAEEYRFTWETIYDINQEEVTKLEKLLSEGKFDEITSAKVRNIIDQWHLWKEATQEMREELTGISFRSLTDGIVSMFEQGKTSVEDFTDFFEKQMQTAILKAFSRDSIEKQMQPWYEWMAELSKDGLTEDEIRQLKEGGQFQGKTMKGWLELSEEQRKQFEDLQKVTGIDFGQNDSANTLKGAYARASQESIDLLAGQTGAMRVHMGELVRLQQEQNARYIQISNDKLANLIAIERNTRVTAEKVVEFLPFLPHLKGIEANTKSNLDVQLRAAGKFGY